MVVDAGHAEAVDGDLLQVDRRAAHFQRAGTGQRVVLEQVEHVAVHGGRQPGVVVVPVEDVEGRWLAAQQVVVDEVVPHQVVGTHPGEDLRHVAAIQHAGLVGAALGGFEGLLVGEQRGRCFHLGVQQADQVGGAADLAQLPLGLQVALQGGDGQAAGAGTDQVEVLAAGDGAAHIGGFLQGLHVAGQAPLAVTRVGVAPADGEHLQAVLQGVLDEALLRRQVEDVELVDLRGNDHQGLEVLLLAHGLVLDQLQHLVAEHHRARCGGQVPPDFEGMLADLAGHGVVVQQVVEQVARTVDQAEAAGVEQLLDRQRIEQAVGRGHGIAEQRQHEACAGAVVRGQLAVVDPLHQVLLPGQVGLESAPVEGVEPPGRIGEARILRVGGVGRVSQQHPAELAAQLEQVAGAVHRALGAVHGQGADGRGQVLASEADNGALHVHEVSGDRQGARVLFLSHGGNTP